MLISCDCYYSEQHSISIVSIRENSVSLYASSPYLTMGSECRRDVTAENILSKEFTAPLVQEGAPVFVHHCAPENWERAPGSRLWSACAEALSGDQTIHCWPVVNWDFQRLLMRPDLGRLGFFPSWEYKQHLLTTYLPKVSSLIISRDVIPVFCFVTTGKKVAIMTTTTFSLSGF